MTFAVIVFAAVINGFILPTDASSFLRPHAAEESEDTTRSRIVRALLAEVTVKEDANQLQQLEEALRPLYTALPKDAQGKLEAPTVRYAVHRHFALWRGWHMKGLERGASELNTTAVSVADVFEKEQGTELQKLALLVSKLTHIADHEAEVNFHNIYTALELSMVDGASAKETEFALRQYLVMYLLGDSTEGLARNELIEAERDVADLYPAWRGAKMWFRDLDKTIHFLRQSQRNPFVHQRVTFADSLASAQELGHRFASFQNLECKSLKSALMDIEQQGSGRVLLSDFYRVGLQDDWQFNENAQYLRSLGALDDSEESVFIPNYLHSPTNCLSGSGFYSVCCFNECEGLMSHLERKLMAPSAEPHAIAEIVSSLESDTVAAPRNFSSALHARLGDIARLHGGVVPLHGRLFAQWMHHAYPRECPFPHLAGSTTPLSQEEWQRRTGGLDPLATKEEMTRRSAGESSEQSLPVLPWTEVEELVAPSHQAKMGPSFSLRPLRWAAGLALLASLAVPLFSGGKASSGGTAHEGKSHRCLV